eukprot:TRINITY_DN5342_c0_g1_i1.p1 TRINITY_DN5342_c0_g1~~TRINITY_DN5342_c0_g1_i1.p1  ORF type:complete len:609 (+),score=130.73 TRINITY_DN5342_c0_g1_i1:108-1934(+)
MSDYNDMYLDRVESLGGYDDARSDQGSIGGSVSVVGASAASGSNTPKVGGAGFNLAKGGSIAECREKHLKCIEVLKRGNQASAVRAAMQQQTQEGIGRTNSEMLKKVRQASHQSSGSEPGALQPIQRSARSAHTVHTFALTPGQSQFATPGGTTPIVAKPIEDPLVRAIKEMSERQAATTFEVHTGVEAFRKESVQHLVDLRSQFETLQKESRKEAQDGLGSLQQVTSERLDSLDSVQQGTSRALEDLKASMEANASKLDCLKPPVEIMTALSNLREAFQTLMQEVGALKTQLTQAQSGQGQITSMSEDLQSQGDLLDALQETLRQHVESQGVTHDALLKQAEAHGSALDELQPKDLRRTVLKLREALDGQVKRVEDLSQNLNAQHHAHGEALSELRRGLATQEKSESLSCELGKAQERCLALKAAHDWDCSAWKEERSRMREEIGRLHKSEATLKDSLREAQTAAAAATGKVPLEGVDSPRGQLDKALPLVAGSVLGAVLAGVSTYFARATSGDGFLYLPSRVGESFTLAAGAARTVAPPRHVPVGNGGRLAANITTVSATARALRESWLPAAPVLPFVASAGAWYFKACAARRARRHRSRHGIVGR